MRWKWRLGLLVMAAAEGPALLWAAVVMGAPLEVLLALAALFTGVLSALLAIRPFLFGLAGVWLLGVAGGAWYFLRYVPAALAVAFSGILSSLACAIVSPTYSRIVRIVVRRPP